MSQTIEERQEEIRVPLIADQSSNGSKELQKLWKTIVFLTSRSSLVEEVYAIRTSLIEAQEDGSITDKDRRLLTRKYKRIYGMVYPLFPKFYDAFDRLAVEIGEDVATNIVSMALTTFDPILAFSDYLWGLSDKVKASLANLSSVQAYKYHCQILNLLDKDDSRYGRKWLLATVAEFEHDFGIPRNKDTEDEFYNFLFGRPDTFLLSLYSYFIHPFSEANSDIQRVNDAVRFMIIVEAIRQQLTQGIGLLCPFSPHSPGNCCGGRARALLEQTWKCTLPDRSQCKRWERMGCLK